MKKSGFDIDELERLLAAATPGEWGTEFDPFDAGDHATAVCLPGKTGETGTFLAYCQHNWNEADYSERRISWKEATTNAALIVAAHNSLPAILTEIRELRAENARLKRWQDEVLKLQSDHYGNGVMTHLRLSEFCDDARAMRALAALGEPQ